MDDPLAEIGRAWKGHDWPHVTNMLAQISVLRTHQLFMADLERALSPFGLTLSRFEVLSVLLFSQQGQLPLGKVGERLQVHPTSITSLVDGLEAQGCVVRVAHPEDRRARLAQITDQGRATVIEAKDAVAECYADIGLTSRESAQLIELLSKVRVFAGDSVDGALLKSLVGPVRAKRAG